MSYSQRPCVCGGTNFHVLPNVDVHIGAVQVRGVHLSVTIVVCTTCTRTEMFTNNAQQITQWIPGARMIAAGQS